MHKLSTISIEPTCVPGSMQTNEDTVVALVNVSKVNRIPENETLWYIIITECILVLSEGCCEVIAIVPSVIYNIIVEPVVEQSSEGNGRFMLIFAIISICRA